MSDREDGLVGGMIGWSLSFLNGRLRDPFLLNYGDARCRCAISMKVIVPNKLLAVGCPLR